MTRYCIIFLSLWISSHTFAQEVRVRTNPVEIISMRYKDAYVKITYSQPLKNGQEIFGKVIPFGKPWSPGSNEATEITTTKDITLGSFLVRAGTYTLFTIPEKDNWTIIVSKDVGLWGSYNYNPRQDLLRFNVPVQTIQDVVYEPLTLRFDQRNDMASLLIMWDQTKITIPVKFLN